MAAEEQLVHATCVDVGGIGLLLLGPPGSGKSDLALRLIDQVGFGISGNTKAARLVADDQVLIRRAGDALFARPPAALAGFLEVRGLGPVRTAFLVEARLKGAVILKKSNEIDRLPDHAASRYEVLGLSLAMFAIDPAAASAAARVRALADWLRGA